MDERELRLVAEHAAAFGDAIRGAKRDLAGEAFEEYLRLLFAAVSRQAADVFEEKWMGR